ncbi:ATP-binding cassette domain-containing protein [Lentimicrobium sp.]|uniref:ATP-binding cassette domain-containing protein n=1 Tax=Lentimicrobium sp. TaxID=2034841 RepID=UPI002CA3EE98|nr:ATP-binding cassette domain-containing protein [Lentimicrobium sp.]HRW69852.1 ATP-binding cassette domain-containing protein [Lentimicrobium sp.]
MLKLEDLCFGYEKAVVINHLKWALEPGKVHGLVGMNGAGKTTLFNILSGMLVPQSGSVLFCDQPLNPDKCAMMETTPFFYPMISGKEYLEIFRLKNPDFNIVAWNSVFHLPLRELVDNYSTGMQKRLALMGLIASGRALLILDEPFNGLDFEAVRIVQQIIPALAAKGKTILLSSHIPESLTSVCHTISIIKEGKIDFTLQKNEFGRLSELLDSENKIPDDILQNLN